MRENQTHNQQENIKPRLKKKYLCDSGYETTSDIFEIFCLSTLRRVGTRSDPTKGLCYVQLLVMTTVWNKKYISAMTN
jgi:hypothetical protein